MVLRPFRRALVPAFIVPDEQTWTVAGADPAAAGLRPAFAPGAARHALISGRMPDVLADGVQAWMTRLPAGVEIEQRTVPGWPGETGSAGGKPAPRRAEAAPDDEHEHEDHDMMAIVGEPSADGLVMEPIDLRFGPLATPLPAGLTVAVTLDGDVVADASVEATLVRSEGQEVMPSAPDLLAPLAWRAALDAASAAASDADRWMGVAAVEIERAVSHLAWLRSLGRLLAWPPLIDRCTAALAAVAQPHRSLSAPHGAAAIPSASDLEGGLRATRRVAGLVHDSRSLRLRTAAVAPVTAEQVAERGLRGPVARASGVHDDARRDDPLYRRLGFSAVVRHEGDAHARTRLRAEEACAALELAAGALRAAAAGTPAGSAAGEDPPVEGPRGPLHAARSGAGWTLAAPGASEALAAAARGMVGLEWAAALVAAASFDLSPWRLPG